MEQPKLTFTQEQLNVVARTYDKKLGIYMQELVNKELTILSLNQKIQQLSKEIMEAKAMKPKSKK